MQNQFDDRKNSISIRPWSNYDFNYGNAINNRYSAQATGASNRDFSKDVSIFSTLLGGLLIDPTPNDKSVAGGTGKDSDYPIYHCPLSDKSCKQAYTLKTKFNRDSGTLASLFPDNPFYKKHKLSGKHASSYYVRTGSCRKKELATKDACHAANPNFEWIEGTAACFAPRYAFIDNSAVAGTIPSLISDTIALSPHHIAAAFSGKSVPGYMDLEKCT